MLTLALTLALAGAPATTAAATVTTPTKDTTTDCDNPALIVDPQAKNVVRQGCRQVQYTVVEPYPATGLVSRLVKKLEADGWKKTEGAVKPGTGAASHQWAEYVMKDPAKTRTDQWFGWFVKDKNLVQLAMNYKGRAQNDKSPLPVTVRLTYIGQESWKTTRPHPK